jgi:hypothetical protein
MSSVMSELSRFLLMRIVCCSVACNNDATVDEEHILTLPPCATLATCHSTSASPTLGTQPCCCAGIPSEAGSQAGATSAPACADNCLLGELRSARARQQVGHNYSITGRVPYCLSFGAYCHLHAIPHLELQDPTALTFFVSQCSYGPQVSGAYDGSAAC